MLRKLEIYAGRFLLVWKAASGSICVHWRERTGKPHRTMMGKPFRKHQKKWNEDAAGSTLYPVACSGTSGVEPSGPPITE
jgi:hypothetical protein